MSSRGMISLVLNAHLPFVRHPEYDWFLEESWFFEAISETYLPLLRVFRALEADSIPFRLVFSISPTLAHMMDDDLLAERYINHLDSMLNIAESEIKRLKRDKKQKNIALMYQELFKQNRKDFVELYESKIINGFKEFRDKGYVEIITTAATHPFLPHFEAFPSAIKAQVDTAVKSHQRLFGENPKGFWLPECGYTPGLEDYFKNHDIKYTVLSAHGVLHADQKPEKGVYAPVTTKNNFHLFGRDRAASRAIWSFKSGFPGNPLYRDFYRDIGFDLPFEEIGPLLGDGNFRVNTGFKYWAITDHNSNNKSLYDPEAAQKQVVKDAEEFVANRLKQGDILSPLMDREPIIICSYDAELFGHWWYEGPAFIENIFRIMAKKDNPMSFTTPMDYLEKYPVNQKTTPAYSSWGEKGYGQVWLDGGNDWIYRHLHTMVERMCELIERYPDESGLKERVLNQAAREVLLAQASDWPFIIKTGTTVPYAIKRIKTHINNFNYIYDFLCSNVVKTDWLTTLEKKNNIFPDIDYRILAKLDE